jgi:dienelactone hydrolase
VFPTTGSKEGLAHFTHRDYPVAQVDISRPRKERSLTRWIRRLGTAFFVVSILLARTSASAGEQSFTLAGLDVTEWISDTAPVGPHPIVIYSHGFHACMTTSRFLAEALAADGFVVFAPNHKDQACGGGAKVEAEAPFLEAEKWNDQTYRDRADDIRRLLAALHSDPRFNAQIDWSRLGLMGHSLGGYTVLALAGAWPSWKIEGVKAVLALAPYVHPLILKGKLGALEAPVMYQCGARDPLITQWIVNNGGAYDESPPPKFLVEFEGATHFAWTTIGRATHEQIIAYAVDFMNRYVKGEAPDPILTHPMPGVAELRSDPK